MYRTSHWIKLYQSKLSVKHRDRMSWKYVKLYFPTTFVRFCPTVIDSTGNATHFWLKIFSRKFLDSVAAPVQLFVDPPLCSVYLSVVAASLTYCCLLVGNGCWRCQSFPRQSCLAYAVPWCLSVLCDGTAGCRAQPTGPSVSHAKENYLCLTRCLCTCVCVFWKKNLCTHKCLQIANSTMSTHTLCCGQTPSRPPFTLQLYPLSDILLLSSPPPCLLLAPFLLLTSCQPHPCSLSLVIPPALLLLSRPSWGVQWDGNGSALVCVCVRACVLVFFCVMLHYVAL